MDSIHFDFDIAILGAGPGGLSAAARAAQRGLSHVLLEAAEQHANTIQQYQRRKHVMAEPSMLPLRSDIAFAAGRREDILADWQDGIQRSNINVRYCAEVVKITRSAKAFSIELTSGDIVRANRVILALGIQGKECADDYNQETIMIVGAGDSAIENAMALSRSNQVIIVNRGDGFPRAKDANAGRIGKAIESGAVQCIYGAAVVRVENIPSHDGRSGCRVVLKTPTGEVSHRCHRVITRLGAVAPRRFIEPIGVRYVTSDADALPELSPRYETSVSGLFIIGALGGYPLIKQALNQGYEVIEHLSGNSVEPADHAILAAKLDAVPFGHDVDATLDLIRERVRMLHGVNQHVANDHLCRAAHWRAHPDIGTSERSHGDRGPRLRAARDTPAHGKKTDAQRTFGAQVRGPRLHPTQLEVSADGEHGFQNHLPVGAQCTDSQPRSGTSPVQGRRSGRSGLSRAPRLGDAIAPRGPERYGHRLLRCRQHRRLRRRNFR